MALDGFKERIFLKYLQWKCRPDRVRRYLEKLFYPEKKETFSLSGKKEIRVAAVQVKLNLCKDSLPYAAEMYSRVKEAVEKGAQLVAFPENNNIQLLGMLPGIDNSGGNSSDDITFADVIKFVGGIYQKTAVTVFSTLAKNFGIYIMAGSFLFPQGDDIVNRAMMFDPAGKLVGYQDKVHLMPEEKDWDIKSGDDLHVFTTKLGKLAFPVCMDATYFETFRILEAKGARVVIIPIANPESYNYWMSLRGIWPRVQESLVFGVKSALVGSIGGFEFTGRAGIYAPIELTPAGDGVLAEVNEYDEEGMVLAGLDMKALEDLRSSYDREYNHEFHRKYFPGIYGKKPEYKSIKY